MLAIFRARASRPAHDQTLRALSGTVLRLTAVDMKEDKSEGSAELAEIICARTGTHVTCVHFPQYPGEGFDLRTGASVNLTFQHLEYDGFGTQLKITSATPMRSAPAAALRA